MNNSTLLQLKEKDFTTHGVSLRQLTVDFQGKTYERVRIIPKIYKKTALEACQEYLDEHRSCLLVEEARLFSIWASEPEQEPGKENSPLDSTPVEYKLPPQPKLNIYSTRKERTNNLTVKAKSPQFKLNIDSGKEQPSNLATEQASPSANPEAVASNQPIDLEPEYRVVYRKYRGTTYAVKVYDEPKITNKAPKKLKKYRGKTY